MERLLAYAQFFATRRSVEPKEPALVPLNRFTAEEQAEYDKLLDELLTLHASAEGTPAEDEVPPAPQSWSFADAGPVTLVCAQLPPGMLSELALPDAHNYTELLSFGDLDAMVELFGHVRAQNSSMLATFKLAPAVKADDLSGHVAIIGGIGWNRVTARILSLARLPVEQREDPGSPYGEIFIITAGDNETKFLPTFEGDPPELVEDVGLIARMPNPMNSSRTLTICNGIHSRGVLGAVRSLTDAQLRDQNERYIANNLPGDKFGILMRVQVIGGKALTPDFSNSETILHQWSRS
ncbi:MAG TPA: hypothetical protein VGG75_22445 [Trebonia sp.]